MRVRILLFVFVACECAIASSTSNVISRAALEDKIRGGWAGKMIGVSYGAASEFHYQGKINEDPLPWKPEMVGNALEQDDMYVQMSFAEVLDRQGLDATTAQFGEAYRQTRFGLCHGNAGARRILDLGLAAPLSGDPRLNIHTNDIDFTIESDFIGLMTPGLPQQALQYATRVGRVMSHGEGLNGGIFVSAMYSAAFFQSDPRKLIERALLSLPEQSEYAQVVRDVLKWSKENPGDWRKTWDAIETKWDHAGSCPDEANSPFNIEAPLNGGYMAMGLLYGHGDFSKTLEIAARAGQDSDCNPATAGGIIGVVLGYQAIPESWKSGIPERADRTFDYTNYSYKEIVASTIHRAELNIRRAGGTEHEGAYTVPSEQPKRAAFERSTMGTPVKVIVASDTAWHWFGNWSSEAPNPDLFCGPPFTSRQSSNAGDSATLEFEGSSVALVGLRSQAGGKADLYVDGNWTAEIDFFIRKAVDTDLWHSNDLRVGKHQLEVRVRRDHNPESTGDVAGLAQAIVYKDAVTE